MIFLTLVSGIALRSSPRMMSMHFSYIAFIVLRYFPSEILIMKFFWIFFKELFLYLCDLSLRLFMQFITFVDLHSRCIIYHIIAAYES